MRNYYFCNTVAEKDAPHIPEQELADNIQENLAAYFTLERKKTFPKGHQGYASGNRFHARNTKFIPCKQGYPRLGRIEEENKM